MSSNTKRTRSQLALPDSFLFPSLQRSPLKEARTASRIVNTTITTGPAMSKNVFPRVPALMKPHAAIEMAMEESAQSRQDEVMLSPRKSAGKKRPSSGGVDDENRGVEGSMDEQRDFKRARTEEPSAPPKYPHTSDGPAPTPKTTPPSRAKSVPPTPRQQPTPPESSTSSSTPKASAVPLIDLNTIGTPWKSPSKETLRIAPVSEQRDVLLSVAKTPRPQSTRPLKVLSELKFLPTSSSETPHTRLGDTTPLSPLTPLPPTPFLDKLRQARATGRSGLRAEISYRDTSIRELDTSSEDMPQALPPSPTPSRRKDTPLTVEDPVLADASEAKPAHILEETLSAAPTVTSVPEHIHFPSSSNTPSDSLGDSNSNVDAKPPIPGPSRLPRISLSSSAGPHTLPNLPAPNLLSSSTEQPPTSSVQQPVNSSTSPHSKKPLSRTGTAGKPHGAAMNAKEGVLGSGRVTRSVALRMKASRESAKTEVTGLRVTGRIGSKTTDGANAKETTESSNGVKPSHTNVQPSTTAGTHTTPALEQRKSFSFSFAVPTASSLSKTKPPTTPGKPKSQVHTRSRPTTPSRSTTLPTPGKVSAISITPGKSSSGSSKPVTSITTTPGRRSIPVPRRAATVAPLEAKSSLSNLSMALEKLSLPPPSRPTTSLGFNHGSDDDKVQEPQTEAKNDIVVGTSSGSGLTGRRATTVEPSAGLSSLRSGGEMPGERRGAMLPPVSKPPPKAPVVGPSAAAQTKKATLDSWLVKGRTAAATSGLSRPAPGKAFGGGTGGGRGTWQRPKASRVPGLPSVEGSPVKGGGGDASMTEEEEQAPVSALDLGIAERPGSKDDDVFIVPALPSPSQVHAVSAKGKEKEVSVLVPSSGSDSANAFKRDASRRASMASQALSQSLSSVPKASGTSPIAVPGSMGPPPVPSTLRAASESPALKVKPEDSEDVEAGSVRRTASGRPMRAAALQARSAPGLLGRTVKGGATHVSAGKKARAASVAPDSGNGSGSKGKGDGKGLGVLDGCTIFVDVRTDEGDDAGGLFVEMLLGLGAKILSRVGQTCTHIVFKNGLMSTVTRYRLLHDPKPHVVGIGWVVECVEQRAKVEEAKFIADLDGVGIAGQMKRRRASMLPKHIPMSLHEPSGTDSSPTSATPTVASDIGDQSTESSSSSLILDEIPDVGDSLPPLERARRRRSMLFGQP